MKHPCAQQAGAADGSLLPAQNVDLVLLVIGTRLDCNVVSAISAGQDGCSTYNAKKNRIGGICEEFFGRCSLVSASPRSLCEGVRGSTQSIHMSALIQKGTAGNGGAFLGASSDCAPRRPSRPGRSTWAACASDADRAGGCPGRMTSGCKACGLHGNMPRAGYTEEAF